jgi:hypothetical protein
MGEGVSRTEGAPRVRVPAGLQETPRVSWHVHTKDAARLQTQSRQVHGGPGARMAGSSNARAHLDIVQLGLDLLQVGAGLLQAGAGLLCRALYLQLVGLHLPQLVAQTM